MADTKIVYRPSLAQGEQPFQDAAQDYDAFLLVSFGGPEGIEDVLPFLKNVLRGRNVPESRMIEVSHHYELFGGVSPINQQNRALISALEADFKAHGLNLPIYWGNRNWHPLLLDTLAQMKRDGVRRAICFFTSMFSCYSGCRQYRENLYDAAMAVGEGAPMLDKLRMAYNHPRFIAANAERLQDALMQIPQQRRANTFVAFTAHSIPLAMAKRSDYEVQLLDAAQLVANASGVQNWRVVYQSRSGAPHIPWLEPDICDYLHELNEHGYQDVVILPLGFVSDHMEVIFDLDVEARAVADELGMNMVRAVSVGIHPEFVAMIRDLVIERMSENPERPTLGNRGPNHDVCPIDCCLPR